MLLPSLICLFLPDTIASYYTRLMYPATLFIAAFFSMRIASIYQKWLRKAFVFLSLFLSLMMLAQLEPHWEIWRAMIGTSFPLFVLLTQWATYAMLVLCALYVLKVTELREVSRTGWLAILALGFLGLIILLYHLPSVLQQVSGSRYADVYTISLVLIRLLDVAIVIMLVPVVILYAQQMKVEGRESVTFTTVICGIILSLTAAYIYELVSGVPLYVIRHAVYQTGSILDAVYLFSYLIIAAGLYVHKKYDEWGYRMVEKVLAGG